MEVSELRIRKVTAEGKLKAYVTVTFDGVFVVHNVKIFRRQNRSFYCNAKPKNGKRRIQGCSASNQSRVPRGFAG